MFQLYSLFSGHLIIKLLHRKPVYGLSLNPQNDSVLATAGDDGRVLIFDLRDSANTGWVFVFGYCLGFVLMTDFFLKSLYV